MIASNVGFYAFPDDASLAEIINKLSPSHRRRLTWRPVDGGVVQMSSWRARVISLIFRTVGARPFDRSLLFVPTSLRPFVNRAIAVLGTDHSTWFNLEGVEFDDLESRRAFEALL